MRLALVYHQFISRGGLEGYVMELARQLQAHGHELDLLTSRIDESVNLLGARVHIISPPPFSSTWMLKRFAERSARLVGTLGCEIALGFGRTWQQDIHRAGGGCHAVYSRMLPAYKRLGWKNQWELSLEQRLYTSGETRHFVVNSRRVREELEEEYAVSEDRITVIHTGVDVQLFRPEEDLAAKKTKRKNLSTNAGDQRVLLFVSLDHRRKGLRAMLAALPKVADAELWIVGAGLDAGWKREVARLGLAARVREFGRQDDLRTYYQCADLFVHPTLYDASANTVLQSMACGLPGIISTRDGARDFVRPGENGWLLENPEDVEELAAKINGALAMEGEMRRIGKAARETMLPMTWEAHVDAWEKLMQRL